MHRNFPTFPTQAPNLVSFETIGKVDRLIAAIFFKLSELMLSPLMSGIWLDKSLILPSWSIIPGF